jgi:hypothetical protein
MFLRLPTKQLAHRVLISLSVFFVVGVVALTPFVVHTQDAPVNVKLFNPLGSLLAEPPLNAPQGDGAVSGATTVALLIGRVVQAILGLLGIAGFVVVIIGGILLLTSAGDSSKIEKGRGILTGAVMGTLIVLTSYLIIRFVLLALQQ